MTVRCVLLVLLLATARTGACGEPVSHALEIRIEPARGTLQISDRIRFPAGPGPISEREFLLHAALAPHTDTEGARLESLGRINGAVPLERYRLIMPPAEHRVTLKYAGTIRHELTESTQSLGRKRQQTPGTISEAGVFLDAASGWYPRFDDALVTFALDIDLPEGWLAISQGRGPRASTRDGRTTVHWVETHPQDDIYLTAGRLLFKERHTVFGEAQVYLRREDADLAKRYLDATERYLGLYSRLIGPYPYAKFALVENFWETGFGMPSFTLLGPAVIRLPFILHSSYPHEILHNWWGNSVYPDYKSGNWSEGLTTYLADHLLQEQQGQGAEYRRDALQRYEDFVGGNQDFPLRRFHSRHGAISQSVGYDKGLMLFHMLRRKLGDQTFEQGLRQFYRQNRFQVAGFEDLQHAFESVSGTDLAGFFRQWTETTGAPRLRVEEVKVAEVPAGYRITARIRQTQKAPPFALDIPITVHFADGATPVHASLRSTTRVTGLKLSVAARPVRLDIDPRFDLFRHLDASEVPPTLSALLGRGRGLIVLPAAAPPQLAKAYRALALHWAEGHPGLKPVWDKDLRRLPADEPVWILGWSNRFRAQFARTLRDVDTAVTDNAVRIGAQTYPRDGFSLTLAGRSDDHYTQPFAWVAAGSPQALPGLTRKLPHYGKYSYLVFSGEAPDIRLKGQWPVTRSALKIRLPAASHDPGRRAPGS